MNASYQLIRQIYHLLCLRNGLSCGSSCSSRWSNVSSQDCCFHDSSFDNSRAAFYFHLPLVALWGLFWQILYGGQVPGRPQLLQLFLRWPCSWPDMDRFRSAILIKFVLLISNYHKAIPVPWEFPSGLDVICHPLVGHLWWISLSAPLPPCLLWNT